MSKPASRQFVAAFAAGLGLFIVCNLIAVHVQSDAGLLEGLGIVDQANDDIRRIGFPLQFFEEGGFAHREVFSPLALVSDILLAIAWAAGMGFGYVLLAGRRAAAEL